MHKCERCGEHNLEKFKSHSYCSSCNFDSDHSEDAWFGVNDCMKLIDELESLIELSEPQKTISELKHEAFEECAS